MHDSNVLSINVFESYMLVAHRMSMLPCCTQGMPRCWSMEHLLAVCLGRQLVNSLRLWVAADPSSGILFCGTANEMPGISLNNNTCETFQSVTHSIGHSIKYSNNSTGRTACCRHHILCNRRQPGRNRNQHSDGSERASALHRALVDCRCPNQSDSLATS